MKKKYLIIILIFFASLNVNSQTTVNTAFKGGEVLRYAASYNMSGLWTAIADVKMEVRAVKVQGRNLYRLVNTARTYQKWDSYFKIRDSYQSWVNPKTLTPYIFKRSVDEGGTVFKVDYVFKRKSLKAAAVKTEASGRKVKKNVTITAGTLDLASVLANVRKIDFAKDKVGSTHYLTVLVDNKLTKIGLKYRGKQTIKVGKYGEKECYRIGVFVTDENIMKNNATNNIWLTADLNKVPVLIKAVIPVGSIQINLVEMSGLRN